MKGNLAQKPFLFEKKKKASSFSAYKLKMSLQLPLVEAHSWKIYLLHPHCVSTTFCILFNIASLQNSNIYPHFIDKKTNGFVHLYAAMKFQNCNSNQVSYSRFSIQYSFATQYMAHRSATFQKCGISGFTPDLLSQNLHFNQILRDCVGTVNLRSTALHRICLRLVTLFQEVDWLTSILSRPHGMALFFYHIGQ